MLCVFRVNSSKPKVTRSLAHSLYLMYLFDPFMLHAERFQRTHSSNSVKHFSQSGYYILLLLLLLYIKMFVFLLEVLDVFHFISVFNH